jgi:short-subunit dehydrogenase
MVGNNNKGYALVMGATSGIGYELCKLFCSRWIEYCFSRTQLGKIA